jgi:hypothetical protein
MDKLDAALNAIGLRVEATLLDARDWLRALIARRRARSLRRWMRSQRIETPPRAVTRRGFDDQAIVGGKSDGPYR